MEEKEDASLLTSFVIFNIFFVTYPESLWIVIIVN